MAMIPFDAHLLRCNPLWSQLLEHSSELFQLTVYSQKDLQWRCSECQNTFIANPNNRRHSSGRCSLHIKSISCATKRRRYTGHIPRSIQTIIRTAVLQGVSVNDLFDNEITIIKSYDKETIQLYLEEVASFSRIDLLDNGFWWHDTLMRANGERVQRKRRNALKEATYKQEKNKKKRKQNDNTSQKELHPANSSNEIYFWLPDHAHWGPVIRTAKWNRELLITLWFGMIHDRLFLPPGSFDDPNLIDTINFDSRQSLMLLYNLRRCMYHYYGDAPEVGNLDKIPYHLLCYLSHLREYVIDCLNDDKKNRSLLKAIVKKCKSIPQLVD